MIAEAKKRSGGRILFEVADAAQLPFADGSFDLVVLMNTVPFFDEIARLLVAGGHATFSFSRGAETPIYVSDDRLRTELSRRGFAEFASFTSAPATAFRALKL
jgi:SAM-dependent methyltransferase